MDAISEFSAADVAILYWKLARSKGARAIHASSMHQRGNDLRLPVGLTAYMAGYL